MHRVAVIHDPTSTHALTWETWLDSAGYAVDRIYDQDSFNSFKTAAYSLVIPLITISDYTNGDNARIEALAYFASKGVKLLTSPEAIAASSDKLKTAEVLRSNSLPHPWTVPASMFTPSGDYQFPIVLKPRFGHSGNEIRLIQNEGELKKYQNRNMLAQKFVESAVCIRVITSHSEALSAYKKVPPKGDFMASIDRGAKRAPLTITEEMKQLAWSAVEALGGGLMGVDLLDSPEGLFVLEANVPFGFDTNDQRLKQSLITYISKELR